jgi:hypothetical protein
MSDQIESAFVDPDNETVRVKLPHFNLEEPLSFLGKRDEWIDVKFDIPTTRGIVTSQVDNKDQFIFRYIISVRNDARRPRTPSATRSMDPTKATILVRRLGTPSAARSMDQNATR